MILAACSKQASKPSAKPPESPLVAHRHSTGRHVVELPTRHFEDLEIPPLRSPKELMDELGRGSSPVNNQATRPAIIPPRQPAAELPTTRFEEFHSERLRCLIDELREGSPI